MGGGVETVKSNLIKFSREKNKQSDCRTKIFVQFHLFEHNKHELNDVKRFCEDLGIDFRVSSVVYSAVEHGIRPLNPKNDAKNFYLDQLETLKQPIQGCSWLAHALAIQPSLAAGPCCVVQDHADYFVKLDKNSFSDFLKSPYSTKHWIEVKHYIDNLDSRFTDLLKQALRNNDGSMGGTLNPPGEGGICSRCQMGTQVNRWSRLERILYGYLVSDFKYLQQASLLTNERKKCFKKRLLALQLCDVVSRLEPNQARLLLDAFSSRLRDPTMQAGLLSDLYNATASITKSNDFENNKRFLQV